MREGPVPAEVFCRLEEAPFEPDWKALLPLGPESFVCDTEDKLEGVSREEEEEEYREEEDEEEPQSLLEETLLVLVLLSSWSSVDDDD